MAAVEAKKRSDQQELEKISAGKATMKSFFKSSNSKENDKVTLQASIDTATKEISEYKVLITFLTIYLGEIAIPKFQKEKSAAYFKSLKQFCVKEINASKQQTNFWSSIKEIKH